MKRYGTFPFQDEGASIHSLSKQDDLPDASQD